MGAIAFAGAEGNPEGCRGLGHGKSSEVTELDELSRPWILGLEMLQGFVLPKQIVAGVDGRIPLV